MSGALDGIKIVDVCHAVVGPWGAMLLASMGAEVVKIEPPGRGDIIRGVAPFQRGLSVVYTHSNFNKKAVILDLKDEGQREVCYGLLARSDILVENMRPGVAERLGLAYETVAELNPRLVYVSASAWGRRGPLASMGGVDPTVQALSGWASVNGERGGKPELYRYGAHLDITTSSAIAAAALLGLLARERTGNGLRVDVTMLGASMNAQLTRLAEFFATGQPPPLMGSACVTSAPNQAFLCKDSKWLAVGVEKDEQWQGLCRALDRSDLAADPRYATNPDRVRHREQLIPELEKTFSTQPSIWWSIKLVRERVPQGPFLDFDALRHHQHVWENGFLATIDLPHQGKFLYTPPPMSLSRTPIEIRGAPYPGQHNAELPEGRKAPHPASSQPGQSSEGNIGGMPLAGTKVLDLTQGLCGPYLTYLMAVSGAEVIKVEPPAGDYARQFGPPFRGEVSAVFEVLNSGKQSVVVDLNASDGADLVRRLADQAAVVVEDLGPGAADKLGLSYDNLSRQNPRLVYTSITPFGEHGPWRDLPGSELVLQAMSETWVSIGQLREPPQRLGADVANLNTGLFGLGGTLLALYHALRTGQGQRVTVSMLATLLHLRGILWSARHDPEGWHGNHQEGFTNPRDLGYQTADVPVYFSLRRGDEPAYVSLLNELDMTHVLEDPRFHEGGREAVGRGRYAAQVRHVWEKGFAKLTAAEVIDLVLRHNGDAVPVNDYQTLVNHPQVRELRIVRDVSDREGKPFKALEPPWSLQGAEQRAYPGAPRLGEHTAEVLSDLGYPDDHVTRLRKASVIAG